MVSLHAGCFAMMIYDDNFSWEGWGGELRLASGECRLRIFDLQKEKADGPAYLRPMIVIVSDIPESRMSVRSCTGHIATNVARQFKIEPDRMLYIEYYPETTYGEHNEHIIAEKYATMTIPVTPAGRTSRISMGIAISGSAPGATIRAHIPRNTPAKAITGYSRKPAI